MARHHEAGWNAPLRGGDVAILCRSNEQVLELALAALRCVADPVDTLAMAELARLSSDDGSWFEAAFESRNASALEVCVPFADALKALRSSASRLTPAEMSTNPSRAP